MASFGIALSFLALLGWGFGDFFIQRAARSIGSLRALFFIAASGAMILFPFVVRDLPAIFTSSSPFWIIPLTSAFGLLPALAFFEGLRVGKITVVEPILILELPITVALSVFIRQEHIQLLQTMAIALVFAGMMLVVMKRLPHFRKSLALERGALFALAAACGLGLGNFIVGVSSQNVGPMVTIWFSHFCFAAYCLILLILRHETKGLLRAFWNAKSKIASQVAFDLTAWLSFAHATTLIPISIATTISEAYIILASLLGIFVNHERIKKHQWIGIALAVLGALTLSFSS